MKKTRTRCHDCPLRHRRESCRMCCEHGDMTEKELKEEQQRLERLFKRPKGRTGK